ncbi:MAG TPA: Crp/Fnr family transcriptional regulator, partial [Actinomycetota bacterium]
MSEAHPAHVDVLRRVPLFADLDGEALRDIAGKAAEVEVPRGHVLLERGQEGAGLFVVLSGTAEVLVGESRIEAGEGEILGELALLVPGLRHTARVQAGEGFRALAVRRDDFESLLEDHPRMAVAMLRVLARRLAETLS